MNQDWEAKMTWVRLENKAVEEEKGDGEKDVGEEEAF